MANERQQLVFSSANENLSLVFRQSGGTDVSTAWHPGASNASLGSLLSTLYAGTVSVTGTLTPSGSSPNRTYSGTLTINFAGNVASLNVPQVEVLSGAVREFEVEAGDGDSDYSADGGSTFALGISQSSFQANQRDIGGAHAAVVCIGDSSAGSGGITSVVVSGAGTTAVNGPYSVYGDDFNGREWYKFDNGSLHFFLVSDSSGCWHIIGNVTGGDPNEALDPDGNTNEYYSCSAPSLTPGAGNWDTVGGGRSAPTPTVTGPTTVGASGANADFFSYFPYGASPSAPEATGTDATHTVLVEAGSVAADVVPSTLVQGSPLLTTALNYNLLTEDTEGDPVDFGAETESGWTAVLQVAESTDTDAVLSCTIEGSTTGDFSGEETVTCTFDDISDRGAQVITSDDGTTTLKQFQRATFLIADGTDPGFAVNVSISPTFTTPDD